MTKSVNPRKKVVSLGCGVAGRESLLLQKDEQQFKTLHVFERFSDKNARQSKLVYTILSDDYS